MTSNSKTRPVIIVEYNPQWAVIFEQERIKLANLLGEKIQRIEHIGSTSVPNLGAKPIIDILIGVKSLVDADQCVPLLQSVGYEYVPEHEREIPERRYFNYGMPRTQHIHMVELTSSFWEVNLLFRDYLRRHLEVAQEYYKLKTKLASQFKFNREGYTNAKAEFIQSVIMKAQAERI
ncbi:MAG: GrpB family protein [Candidatus Heimdallarchaeota archaeon]|nr:GrpB family protein [Candidatus Heimdallarchaeota archaeon]MCK5049162.1 GrpB family protein [Candidatus Heimdallarchaeota archaeon]